MGVAMGVEPPVGGKLDQESGGGESSKMASGEQRVREMDLAAGCEMTNTELQNAASLEQCSEVLSPVEAGVESGEGGCVATPVSLPPVTIQKISEQTSPPISSPPGLSKSKQPPSSSSSSSSSLLSVQPLSLSKQSARVCRQLDLSTAAVAKSEQHYQQGFEHHYQQQQQQQQAAPKRNFVHVGGDEDSTNCNGELSVQKCAICMCAVII